MTRRRQTFASEMRPLSGGSGNEWPVNYETVGHPPELWAPRVAWRGQASIVERFWSRVNKSGPLHRELGTRCWEWTGCVVARYGQISLGHPSTPGAKRWKTHRFSWELHNGPIPDGLRVCHACDNPLCVNPAHLFLGTQKENVHDAIRKGRRCAFGVQKLNPDDVRVIRAQLARGLTHREIAAAFRVGRTTITNIATGATWAHLCDSHHVGHVAGGVR